MIETVGRQVLGTIWGAAAQVDVSEESELVRIGCISRRGLRK